MIINKKALLFPLFFLPIKVFAQFTYGTTGLIDMPTADMQEQKTLMLGASFLEKHSTPARWDYNTYNYYLNITFFPWLEVAYDCTLHKALPYDPAYGSGFWAPYTYGKFVNQDRNFALRLRVWKEGWWKDWTPQIVVGANDAVHDSWTRGNKFSMTSQRANGFMNRWYLAVSKHFGWKYAGIWGFHATYMKNKRIEYPLNGLALGVNFKFDFGDNLNFYKYLNGLNLMLEAYPANGRGAFYKFEEKITEEYDRGLSLGKYDINVGAEYEICLSKYKQTQKVASSLNFLGELYGCKDFSCGVQFKVHLK